MIRPRIVARLLVAAAVGTAILMPATTAVASAHQNYIGPYATFELCEADRQADPASVGKCVFLDDSTHPAGWYWRFNGQIGNCPPCPAGAAGSGVAPDRRLDGAPSGLL